MWMLLKRQTQILTRCSLGEHNPKCTTQREEESVCSTSWKWTTRKQVEQPAQLMYMPNRWEQSHKSQDAFPTEWPLWQRWHNLLRTRGFSSAFCSTSVLMASDCSSLSTWNQTNQSRLMRDQVPKHWVQLRGHINQVQTDQFLLVIQVNLMDWAVWRDYRRGRHNFMTAPPKLSHSRGWSNYCHNQPSISSQPICSQFTRLNPLPKGQQFWQKTLVEPSMCTCRPGLHSFNIASI